MAKVICVFDVNNDQRRNLVLAHVVSVDEPTYDGDDWGISIAHSGTSAISEEDARRVLTALDYTDPASLSPSELQAEWERAEAWLTRLGGEMRRRQTE